MFYLILSTKDCFSICLSILICKNRQKRVLPENLQTSKKGRKMSLLSIFYKQSCVSQNRKVNSRNWWQILHPYGYQRRYNNIIKEITANKTLMEMLTQHKKTTNIWNISLDIVHRNGLLKLTNFSKRLMPWHCPDFSFLVRKTISASCLKYIFNWKTQKEVHPL